jgi:hypothetical protein
MPMIDAVLNANNTGTNVHELHVQLLAVGAMLDADEQTTTSIQILDSRPQLHNRAPITSRKFG